MIGEEIKKRVKKKGLKNKAFADLMNIEERNLYHFFKKEQMDVDQLLQASKVLDFDFLTLYIKNSKYKEYLNDFKDVASDNISEYQTDIDKNNNQISFSICIKGKFDTISQEMSNFLQVIKKEAEDRGLELA